MKLLHVGMGWFGEEVGGLTRFMSQAVTAQHAHGHQARCLVTGSDKVIELSAGLAQPFAEPRSGLPSRLVASRRAVSSALADFDPDIVSFHFALYGRPSLGLVRARPWVMHFHGPWALEARAEGAGRLSSWIAKNVVEGPLYRSAPRAITLSKAFARILEEEYGVDPDRIRVVPGGFDPDPFLQAPDRRSARLRLGLPADRPILVCVRRLAARMGLENLVDAVGVLRRKYPDVLVAIAGKGPIGAALSARIEGSGLSRNIRLLGFVPDADLPSLYAAGDLSVVPTVALEGFGLIVAESLASGTPVVATRVGALPELLSGFSPDLLAEPGPESLADVLAGALAGGGVPGPEQCRAHAMGWSWARVVPRLEEVYREAGAA